MEWIPFFGLWYMIFLDPAETEEWDRINEKDNIMFIYHFVLIPIILCAIL